MDYVIIQSKELIKIEKKKIIIITIGILLLAILVGVGSYYFVKNYNEKEKTSIEGNNQQQNNEDKNNNEQEKNNDTENNTENETKSNADNKTNNNKNTEKDNLGNDNKLDIEGYINNFFGISNSFNSLQIGKQIYNSTLLRNLFYTFPSSDLMGQYCELENTNTKKCIMKRKNFDDLFDSMFTSNYKKEFLKEKNCVEGVYSPNTSYVCLMTADKVYINQSVRGSDVTYHESELKVLSESENKITYNVISYYCEPDEEGPNVDISYKNCIYRDWIIEKTEIFEIVKENGSWKVNKFVIPN